MKLNYSEFCSSDSILVNNKEIKENSVMIELATNNLYNYLIKKYGYKEIFKTFMQTYGEYENTKRCEQCGNYDTIINLEI